MEDARWRTPWQLPTNSQVETVDVQVDEVYTSGMDQFAAVEKGLLEEMSRLSDDEPWLVYELSNMTDEEALELGCQGARAALAPLIWSAAVGDRWDVRRATEFLGISRQALYKRLRNGSALGIPGRGTTWFPVWQFDPRQQIVRAVTGSIVRAFREADAEIDPLVIAAWARNENRLLEGKSPAIWLAEAGSDDAVVLAARRAAQGLAA
jgi:hypothetical protein